MGLFHCSDLTDRVPRRRNGRCGGTSFASRKNVPILDTGSTTRSIGRLDKEESPSRRTSKGCPARTPINNRVVVPELPHQIGLDGRLRPSKPWPWISKLVPCRSI